MAEADPIQRMKAAARRAAGPVSIETQRNWHYEELEKTIGRNLSSGHDVLPPHRSKRGGFWSVVLGMTLLAIIVFAVTAAVMAWRNGKFDALFERDATAPRASRPWTLPESLLPSVHSSAAKTESDAPPNEVEPLLNPPAPPPPPPESEESEADESGG